MKQKKIIALFSQRVLSFLFLSFVFFYQAQVAFSQNKGKIIKNGKTPHSVEIRTLNDTIIQTLVNKVATYTFSLDRAKFQLQGKYDLDPVEDQLPAIEERIKGFRSIFDRVGQRMNLQGLSTSTIILNDLAAQLRAFKSTLDGYRTSLTESNRKVSKILRDTALQTIVTDSSLTSEIASIISEGGSLDSSQQFMLARINLLNDRVSVSALQARDIISDMTYLSIVKKDGLLKYGSQPPLLQDNPQRYTQSTPEVIQQGVKISGRVILIYLSSRIDLIVWGLILICLIYIWSKINYNRIIKRTDGQSLKLYSPLLRKSMVVGFLFLFLTYLPWFFIFPPSALLHVIELLGIIALTFLIFPFFSDGSKKLWIPFVALWLIYALDDLLLRTSFGERWYLFIADIILSFICISAIRQRKKLFTNLKYSSVTLPLLVFTLLMTVTSLVLNLAGNFSLSKIIGLAGIQALMMGIVLRIFCEIILESVYLQSEAYNETRFSELLNFEKLKYSLRRYLWIVACVIWILSLTRDLTLYKWFSHIFLHFIDAKRPLGIYHFTFGSVFIFIFVIWLSSVLSRIINYFFGYERSVSTGKRNGINSMILILRLCIWAVGFLIAIAAAGIPLDKVSIMLGALGVGIGFGLQTIVNNLVSGVILAFERPIQVGDQIEIGDKSGTVKEIGVRASKINNSEGADIIIPNGDLLSQHLVNWTMQNRNKRVGFSLGVGYDTDLEKVRTLILDKLKDHKDILASPEPSFLVMDFGPNTIHLKTIFWIAELNNTDAIRTGVMMDVKKILSDEKIQLQARFPNPFESGDNPGGLGA